MIELQYFPEDDFKQLIDWIDSEQLLFQWSGVHQFTFPLDSEQLAAYIKPANKKEAELLAYKVVETETGNSIGHISLGKIDSKNKSARIGRVLIGDKKWRGRGIAREIIRLILEVAFSELDMHRVSLGVYDFNKPAIACYRAAGFQVEGHLRHTGKVGDDYWSMYEMSILRAEWLERKADSHETSK